MPAPAAVPATLTPPPAASGPAPTERSPTQPISPPEAATPETHQIEIEIEDGELETELDRFHSHGGEVRLRIRSDRFVIVEVEDRALSWPILAGGEALISFDTGSVKSYELELRRHKGVLVLRLDD